MANYALIRNNEVQNIILIDNDPELLEHFRAFHNADEIIEATNDSEIGGTYANGIFTRKPIPEPIVEE